MRLGFPSFAVPLAAAAAAFAAPLVLHAPLESALSAGTVVALAACGVRLAIVRDRHAPAASRLMAGGLLVAALGAAVPVLPGAPAWLQPVVLLAGSLALSAGVGLFGMGRERAELESAQLHATLSRREDDVRAQAERLRRVDQYDMVTGLLHRRAFLVAAADALDACARESSPLALVLIEFAAAEPGAPLPDLRTCGSAVRQAVRGSDVAGTWDRGVFALLLPRCEDPHPAVRRLEARLREAGAEPGIEARLAGVAVSARGPWPDAEGLLASAGAALAATRSAPASSEVALWPIDWGLASAESGTGPVGVSPR